MLNKPRKQTKALAKQRIHFMFRLASAHFPSTTEKLVYFFSTRDEFLKSRLRKQWRPGITCHVARLGCHGSVFVRPSSAGGCFGTRMAPDSAAVGDGRGVILVRGGSPADSRATDGGTIMLSYPCWDYAAHFWFLSVSKIRWRRGGCWSRNAGGRAKSTKVVDSGKSCTLPKSQSTTCWFF